MCFVQISSISKIGRDNMAISEARKRANDKWRSKFIEVRFRVTPEKKAIIDNYAKEHNESVTSFLNRAVDEAMARDSQK